MKTTTQAPASPLKQLSHRLDKFFEGKLWLKVLIAPEGGITIDLPTRAPDWMLCWKDKNKALCRSFSHRKHHSLEVSF